MKVHSYGAGVQSVALLWKYLRNAFERPDLVIFADTQAEPASVYESVTRDQEACAERGVEFVIVTAGDLGHTKPGIFIPAYTLNKNGRKGTLLRQCTDRFKIAPIKRELRKRGATKAEIWLGISTDEASRMKDSNAAWLTNRYPLIEINMSRGDCETYLAEIGVTASKSACVFCPYGGKKRWLSLSSTEREAAIEYDERLRNRMKGVKMFVHDSRLPLREAVELMENGDPDLFNNECEGYCGL